MRKCERCHTPIPAERLAALPDTTRCVVCTEEKPLRGFMSWEHKTAPTIVIGTEEAIAELRRNDRRGPHAQLPVGSPNNPRMVASMANISFFTPPIRGSGFVQRERLSVCDECSP